MASAARQPLDRKLEFARDRLDAGDERRRERDRVETRKPALSDRHSLVRGSLGDECGEAALSFLKPFVVGVAQVDRHHRALGDDIDEIGRQISAPTVAT